MHVYSSYYIYFLFDCKCAYVDNLCVLYLIVNMCVIIIMFNIFIILFIVFHCLFDCKYVYMLCICI